MIIKFINTPKSIEDALGIVNDDRISIIAEDKTDKGSVVFLYKKNMDSLQVSFVRKNSFGYKNLYSGSQTDVTKIVQRWVEKCKNN